MLRLLLTDRDKRLAFSLLLLLPSLHGAQCTTPHFTQKESEVGDPEEAGLRMALRLPVLKPCGSGSLHTLVLLPSLPLCQRPSTAALPSL